MSLPPKLRSEIAQSLLYLDGKPFSMANYPFYPAIYDGDYPQLLLKTARQVAKTVRLTAPVSLANGFCKPMKDIGVGDVVLSLDTVTQKLVPKKVTWVSHTYKKRCRRVTTRQGHVLDLATTHPVRTWESWDVTSKLRVGTRVAAIRQGGVFTRRARPSKARIELTACLIGDGYLTQKDIFIPEWVFDLSRKDTALFLNRLWSADGCCGNEGSKFTLEFTSVSNRLVHDVQSLLWKFGIPSSIRCGQPKVYRKKHPGRYAYKVRIETQEGVRSFLQEIGALGKSERVPLPSAPSNNNRDTFPSGINELIKQIAASQCHPYRRGRFARNTLYSAGLRLSLAYPPTHGKLRKYIDYFKTDSRHDQHLVDRLETHANGDIYWDRVTEIEDLGVQECRDICVEDTHNFCVDGVITHNSTTLCNFMISESIGIPHFRTLYVSPTQEQTQTFSNTRLGKVVFYSPFVRQYFMSSDFTSRTMLRMFRNGSEIKLTYACDDPDRARGNTADRACYDKDAYALTRSGWKLIRELREDDLVADVNDDGVVEWSFPENIFSKKYTGEMVTFKHRGFHLRVTADHNVWANFKIKHDPKYKQEDIYTFHTADSLAQTTRMGFKLSCQALWTDESPESFCKVFEGSLVSRYAVEEYLCLPWKPFAELTGWYIAEGSLIRRKSTEEGLCYPRPVLHQQYQRIQDILKCVNDLNLPHRVGKRRSNNSNRVDMGTIRINSLSLGRYYDLLGLSRDKRIPREFFDKPQILESLLEGLYRGDACLHPGEKWSNGTLRTRSKRLAEDVQEAWLRLGRPAPIHVRTVVGEPLYEICAHERDYKIFWRADFKKKNRVTTEHVEDEEVYCFTVAHHRPIVKGSFESHPIICGQCFDEAQDILYDAVIPVISECMANSKYAYATYTGTPKTMENTMEYLWSLSTMTEWIMQCAGCGKYNYVETERSLGLEGPICLKCGHLLNPRHGKWYDFQPGKSIKGFHISQPILPENCENPVRWKRLLEKRDRYSETKFKNEVLGMSDAIGARLISKEELESLCQDYDIYRRPMPGSLSYTHVVGGVDWSGGGVDGVSRTVAWIFGVPPEGLLRTLYFRIYPVTSPVEIIADLAEVFKAYNVNLVAGDRGEGHLANNLLARELGQHRVIQIQYGSQAKPISHNTDGSFYSVDRTTVMDNYFMVLKRRGVVYPKLEYMREPLADMLNIYEEITNNGKKVWRHAPTKPDDSFHAQLFAWLAAKILLMDLQFRG